jgi:hypothetical protein
MNSSRSLPRESGGGPEIMSAAGKRLSVLLRVSAPLW